MKTQTDKILQSLSAELDGELSPEELRSLEQALGDQEELRNSAASWAEIGRRLGDTSEIPVPRAEEMLARVQAAKDRMPSRGRPLVSFPGSWAAVAAAAILLFLAAGFWFGVSDRRAGSALTAWEESQPVLWVETHVPDSSAVVYEDEETGVTVIWMVTDTVQVQGG